VAARARGDTVSPGFRDFSGHEGHRGFGKIHTCVVLYQSLSEDFQLIPLKIRIVSDLPGESKSEVAKAEGLFPGLFGPIVKEGLSFRKGLVGWPPEPNVIPNYNRALLGLQNKPLRGKFPEDSPEGPSRGLDGHLFPKKLG
jgi:hypothetical protein